MDPQGNTLDAPAAATSIWPKDAWYVAATPDEIDGKPLGRQICGERIVFFRNAEGLAVAVEDFCPHRGAPLSLGFVRDGNLFAAITGLQWVAGAMQSKCPVSG